MKNQIFLTSVLLTLVTTCDVYAQNTSNLAHSESAQIEVIQQGELRLDGKVTGIMGASQWTMDAFVFTSPRGAIQEFDEPKSKVIKISPTTLIHIEGQDKKLSPKSVRLASLIAVIGKNGPENSLIAREIILLQGYENRQVVGALELNILTSNLIDESRRVYKMGQIAKALALAEYAAQNAVALNDKTGEILATRDAILIYLEIGEFQSALDASIRIERSGRDIGNELGIAAGLNGKGEAYAGLKKEADAIKAFEEALPYSLKSSSALAESILNNLVLSYISANQFDSATQALEKLSKMQTYNGKREMAVQSLIIRAIFRADEDATGSQSELVRGEKIINRFTLVTERATMLMSLAILQWRLGQNKEAKTRLEEAKKLFLVKGESKSATRMQSIITYLETAPNSNSSAANAIFDRIPSSATKTN